MGFASISHTKVTDLETHLSDIGDISSLETSDKSSVVTAINELVSSIESLNDSLYHNEIQEKRENKYWRTNNAVVGESWDGNSTNLDGTFSSVKLNVNSADIFFFYGAGNNGTQIKTYVITDGNNIVLEISNTPTATDYRTIPLKITIPDGGKNLYVNFGSTYYNSSDKLTKLVKYDFAENIADITSSIGDLSNLHTKDKTNIVNAVNEVADKFNDRNSIEQPIREGKYWNTGGISIGSSFTGNSKNLASAYSVELVSCYEGDVFEFYGTGNNGVQVKTYVICDANDVVIAISSIPTGTDYRTSPYTIIIPDNGAKLYVNWATNYDEATDLLK